MLLILTPRSFSRFEKPESSFCKSVEACSYAEEVSSDSAATNKRTSEDNFSVILTKSFSAVTNFSVALVFFLAKISDLLLRSLDGILS